jgi:hypothetical protein
MKEIAEIRGYAVKGAYRNRERQAERQERQRKQQEHDDKQVSKRKPGRGKR